MKPDMLQFRNTPLPVGGRRLSLVSLHAILFASLLAACGGGGYGGGTPTPSAANNPMPGSSITALSATLTGAQETPPNASAATGSAAVNVDTTAKTFTATVTTAGITGTAAHIHAGAPGVAGPILFPLAETPPGSSKWTTSAMLSDAQLQALLAGGYYANVHSAAFPAGEIRGQLTKSNQPPPGY